MLASQMKQRVAMMATKRLRSLMKRETDRQVAIIDTGPSKSVFGSGTLSELLKNCDESQRKWILWTNRITKAPCYIGQKESAVNSSNHPFASIMERLELQTQASFHE